MSDEEFKELLQSIPSNPGKLQWLQDKNGLTSGIKKEGIALAGRIGGDKEKMLLALRTLAIISQHIKVRLKADEEHAITRRNEMKKAEEARLARQRFE